MACHCYVCLLRSVCALFWVSPFFSPPGESFWLPSSGWKIIIITSFGWALRLFGVCNLIVQVSPKHFRLLFSHLKHFLFFFPFYTRKNRKKKKFSVPTSDNHKSFTVLPFCFPFPFPIFLSPFVFFVCVLFCCISQFSLFFFG